MLVLFPAAFLASLAVNILSLGMLFLIKGSYGAGPETVGWFSALTSLTYFVGCLVLKPLSDRLGARAATATMASGSALLFGLHLLAPGLPSAFAVYGVYGFITALFWPPIEAWAAAGLEGPALSRATSSFNLAWSSGGFIAPYVGGLLSEQDILLPIYVSIVLFVAIAILILSTGRIAPSPSAGELAEVKEEAAEDHSTSLRFPAWIGAPLVYVLIGVFCNIFPLFAKDELGLSPSTIGFALLVRAGCAMLGFWLLGRLDFWQFKKKFIVLPTFLCLLITVALVFARSLSLFICCLAAIGLLQSMIYTNSIFYGASGAADRGRRMTIHEALLTVGQVLGSVAGGLLYGRLSFGSIFVFTAILFAAGVAAQLFLLQRKA
jgi:DHA1 family multidrug resistance protein-like MFS transporter/DHA1 family quinolone resistance protein-like MFS transporter